MTTHHGEPMTRSGSLWTATAELPVCPPLAEDLRVDVCIVGGGIAGMTIAYLLTRAGKSVAVLDDGPLAGGQTSTGSQQSSGTAFGMQQDRQPEPERHSEGVVARTIEEQTARLPSDTFLWAAVGAMAASAIFEFTGARDKSRFIGQWVAPMLLFGVYNKLVKQEGSDRVH